jgi:hypothetical protein
MLERLEVEGVKPGAVEVFLNQAPSLVELSLLDFCVERPWQKYRYHHPTPSEDMEQLAKAIKHRNPGLRKFECNINIAEFFTGMIDEQARLTSSTSQTCDPLEARRTIESVVIHPSQYSGYHDHRTIESDVRDHLINLRGQGLNLVFRGET